MMSALPVVVQSADGKVFQFPGEPQARQFEKTAKEAGGGTLRLVPITPPASRPLYELEQHLAALVDTEEIVPPEQEEEFARDLQQALLATVEKRDRVGQFLLHLREQVAFAKAERARLADREAFYQRAVDRLETYVTRVIESLGVDGRGKRKKLEGKVLTLALHGCDKRVDVTDAAAVPAKYKRATITLPAETWHLVCASLDSELRARVVAEMKSVKVEISAAVIKPDLKAGIAVPGAQLAGGTYVEIK